MYIFTASLVFIIALEHFAIMGLEMLGSDALLAKSFDISVDEVKRPVLRTALANQGMYNGFVALALFLAIFIPTGVIMKVMVAYFLTCIVILAAYGAITVSKKIFIFQGLPAMITLLLSLFFL
ncbi:DUF1304 domain-containing protein [Pediococcus stilesii]|uniref:DUF1304 domain-containing protein n=1 Tax=Pediococcus stilesii TaxID=331679 RepID=A0A0R2KXF5_9LACO|nr:DUF1304 domain-containing protein [Pediococcus stilesii]KRN94129.1 hypothetical protein IV81_GL001542 [Pediococcus stilesii]TLQ04412.1 DUF1304 domain-containing protein [Pediococcus stilesii]